MLKAQYLQAAINFALHSAGAKGVSLCLFTEADLQHGKVSHEVDLHTTYNKTGDIWHIAVPQLDSSLLYGMSHPIKMYEVPATCSALQTIVMQHAYAGFKVKGDHEEEQAVDHCTIETFDSMQSAEEDTVRIVNPGQRFNDVSTHGHAHNGLCQLPNMTCSA